ncbi:HAD hydrolase-like protein [Heyndrickxia sp. NPDC080065]|uniref:HAD hydrolase-like protein n=1 Tax=Heyndrickxia sp. NPDC080065 TaxID=3390568 RepID=UPI003D02D3D2
MTKSIIFDMDGTLFQTNKILEISLSETFEYLRVKEGWEGETPIEKYREIMGVPLPVVWENLLPNYSNDVRIMANDFFHAKLIDNIYKGNGELYPNVTETFAYLKSNGYTIFVASNGLPEYLSAIVEYYKLNQWLTDVYSIQQIESQDKAELVRILVQKYNITGGALVGDRISDIRAAKSNGLLSIGCNFDFAQAEELQHADRIINDISELKSILEEGAFQIE